MPSPEIAVSVPVVQRLGLPTFRMLAPQAQDMRGSQLSIMDNRSKETLPIMLDTSAEDEADLVALSLSDVETAVLTPELPTWHRRVGDECPTFFYRKENARSRKMSPPPPLSLHTTTTRKMIAIQVEPSPLESPGQAIRQIQDQLKKLEDLERASPQNESQRLALLEDLEREMGQQAEHWQEIKYDMTRDSLSTMQTASSLDQPSRRESVASTTHAARESNLRQSIGVEHRASLAASMQQNGSPGFSEASVRNSGSPKLSRWQKRLTEAQMDYMDAQLFRSSSIRRLQLSRAQITSPTPPDSDTTSADEVPSVPDFSEDEVSDEQPYKALTISANLWTLVLKETPAPMGALWTATPMAAPDIHVPLPCLSVRPALRKELAPLQIKSSQLWRKPYNTTIRATSGLWRPLWASAAPPAVPLTRGPSPKTSQKAPHPTTQRPPRRSRRMTLLPDILESPEPLPDRSGTLGIFQFPWGEKSDTASMRSNMYLVMPGTMTSGGPSLGAAAQARSEQLEPTEYTSSFFDHYDDEDGDDSTDSDSDEHSDDGFDDSTLWEIASLLKSDAVPSRGSLLPPSSGSVVGDYMDELASDEEGQNQEQSNIFSLGELREQQRDSKLGSPANLKTALDHDETAPPAGSAAPSPIPEVSRMRRASAEAPRAETSGKQGSAGLWYPPSQADKLFFSTAHGLFKAEPSRPESRGTSENSAGKYFSRRPRPVEQKPLGTLTSTQLWKAKDVVKQRERNWIHGAKAEHQGSSKVAVSHCQRPQASIADWKAALDEAITASYPARKLNRITASSAEWDAALQEAIALSGRRAAPQPVFDSSTRHPVFAARSLIARSEWFHPAATGYTYNVAVVHPVFFGSLAITCPEEAVHPAFSAYAAKKLRRQRSKQQRDRERPSSSRSRSTSRRKEEIRAQIRALEQQQQQQQESAGDDVVYTSSEAPPPLPRSLSLARRDSTQARIEALEEERLFAQRVAQEKHRRRQTTMASSMTAPMPTGAETVQDLQRRLSQQIRESLVFSTPSTPSSTKKTPAPVAISIPPSSASHSKHQLLHPNHNDNDNDNRPYHPRPLYSSTSQPQQKHHRANQNQNLL
ncbi:hypothetical protein N0V88_005391 [Collariella sp. IMI 366227]|nr:hypothetical protein N0V88_005391 [Collariella sp. IMI 366227]